MHRFVVAACLLFAAPMASAKIAEPTLSELIRSSSNIATGRVIAILPMPFSPFVLFALILLGAFVAARRAWRQKRLLAAFGRAIGVLTVGLIGMVALMTFTTFSAYQHVAVVQVQQSHRGTMNAVVPVFYRTSFVCDVSHLDMGQRYVFFLNESFVGYQPSWYGWSFIKRNL